MTSRAGRSMRRGSTTPNHPQQSAQGAATAAPSAVAITPRVDEVMSSAIGNLRGLPAAEAPPGRLPTSPVEELRPITGDTAKKEVDKPKLTAVSTARLQGQGISYKEFIAAVQEAGALETVGEAEAAAEATLDELGRCLSWTQAQNLAQWLPKPLRQRVSRRSFESSLSRFAPQAFVRGVAEHQGISPEQTAGHTRAVLSTLDRTLADFLTEQLHSERASLWGPLTAGARQ
jgi:uncharacterized protein (DUF2267 family)